MRITYNHVAAFRVVGICASDATQSLPLANPEYACVLTKSPDSLLLNSDRASCLVYLLLTGLFGPGTTDESRERRLGEEVAEAQRQRAAQHPGASYLVLTGPKQCIDITLPESRRELPSAVLAFDAVDAERLRETVRPRLAQAVASLSIALPAIVGLEPAINTLHLVTDSGKQLVSMTAKVGDAIFATGLTREDVNAIATTTGALELDASLTSSYIHWMQSLLVWNEPLPAFRAGWKALETLIAKISPAYWDALCALPEPSVPSDALDVWRRGAGTPPHKRTLRERFTCVAAILDPGALATDTADFCAAKKMRDDETHADGLDAELLPTRSVVRLVRKLTHLHSIRHKAEA